MSNAVLFLDRKDAEASALLRKVQEFLAEQGYTSLEHVEDDHYPTIVTDFHVPSYYFRQLENNAGLNGHQAITYYKCWRCDIATVYNFEYYANLMYEQRCGICVIMKDQTLAVQLKLIL